MQGSTRVGWDVVDAVVVSVCAVVLGAFSSPRVWRPGGCEHAGTRGSWLVGVPRWAHALWCMVCAAADALWCIIWCCV
jgi:hypothetical protein